MRSRLVFWLQLASLLFTGWLLWQPVTISRWPHSSPALILLQAALYAAAACLAGGLITLVLYLLLQQDPEHMVRTPLSTSTAAIWFAPAVILFAVHSPAALVAALALVINATRVLYDQWKLSLEPAPPVEPAELFGGFQMPPPSFWRLLAPSLAASFCAQSGIAAAILHQPALAGFALAMAAATLTVFAQSSRAVVPRRPPNLPRSVLGLLLTLVLAIGLTVGGMMPRFRGHGFGDGGTASKPTTSLPSMPPGDTPSAVPFGAADSGFFGVILWPEVKPYATLIAPMPQTKGGLGTGTPPRPLSIPFSGEYWMYRWPFARPPQNSYFQRGTPAELSFSTTDRRPLQMEARHKLEQPIAIDCCRSVQIELRNADRYLGTIVLELYLIDNQAARRSQVWAGRAPVISRPQISGDNVTAMRETLEFPMPAFSPIEQFDEFRIVFTRERQRLDKSAKIALERFILVPK
jgi:hypothetical protein